MKHGNHDAAINSGGSKQNHLSVPEPLDLGQVHSVDSLVRAMATTAFSAREVGNAANVLEAMARDQDCFVVMTLAGAITIAEQRFVITKLMDCGIVNAIVSTGEIMAHALMEATAGSGYDPELSAPPMEQRNDDRMYDTLASEQHSSGPKEVLSKILESWDHNEAICSYKLNHLIGQFLARNSTSVSRQSGILRSAYEKGIPVFVPTFTDSEFGLDFALNNRLRESTGRHRLRYDPFEDLEHFSATLLRQNRLGIFAIGGGVPRDWSQQFAPFIQLRRQRLGENVPLKRYHYGVSICSEPAHSSNLPGSSSDLETQNFPVAEGGQLGEVKMDATICLPLIVAAVLERLGHVPSTREKDRNAGNGQTQGKARKGKDRVGKRALRKR